MLLAEPSRQLDLMTLAECSIISPTSIYSYQRAVVSCSLSPIPRSQKTGFERTNRTKPVQAERPTLLFIQVVFN